jgi:condensin complex subunit 3
MPGRVSRSARSSAVSRKSSTQTLKSRASTLAVEIPEEGPETSLRVKICTIFAEAQRNTATQRKLAVNLRKVQERCCYEPVERNKKSKGGREDFGEQEFNEEVGRCVLRVLGVKKSEAVGDRIVKFLGLFLKLANEKGKHHVDIVWKHVY